MQTFARSIASRLVVITLAAAALPACGLMQRKAVGMVASTLASSGDVFTRDDDPELVGDAIPFGLKLYESLLDSKRHGIDKPDLVIDMPVVRTLAERALALDESWNKGALHEMFISLESLPAALGGDPDRARKHFARAVELQHGEAPGPYVALATGVALPAQHPAEFEKLLNQALAIDPTADQSNQLVTIITQRRARSLLEHVDDLFIQ